MPGFREVPGSALRGEAAFLGPVSIAEANGIELSFRRFGAGPELLLIAGQAAPMSIWPLSWLRTLEDSHTVTIFDNRGLGLSSDDRSVALRLATLADDAAELIAALVSGPCDVLGVSTGGEIALLLAAAHPEAVDGLVVSGASLGGPGTVVGDQAAIAKLADPATPVEEVLGLLFPPGHDDAVQRILADWEAIPQTEVPADVTARYDEAERAYTADPRLPALWAGIQARVLVHHGELDQIIPAVNAHQLAAALPNATVVVTPRAGHLAIFQEAAAVLPVIENFLDRARRNTTRRGRQA